MKFSFKDLDLTSIQKRWKYERLWGRETWRNGKEKLSEGREREEKLEIIGMGGIGKSEFYKGIFLSKEPIPTTSKFSNLPFPPH